MDTGLPPGMLFVTIIGKCFPRSIQALSVLNRLCLIIQQPETGYGILKEVNRENSNKNNRDRITIIDKQNIRFVVHAAKGNDLFALWNILLMAFRLMQE